MPSPVDEESTNLNKTMRKGVGSKGQDHNVCKCSANCDPTDLKSEIDTNGNEENENCKNSSKVVEEFNIEEQKKPILDRSVSTVSMTEKDKGDFIVTFSCTQCACIASSNTDDKEVRKKRKQSRLCVCTTFCSAVIFCLMVTASLIFLTFKLSSDMKTDNQIPDSNTQTNIVPYLPNDDKQSETVMKRQPALLKYELDVDHFNSDSSVLPWAEAKGSNSLNKYRYDFYNRSFSLMESGVYFIKVTLSAELSTSCEPNGGIVTIVPCIKYKNNIENCQRLKFPSGMAFPIHLQDVVKMEAFDTVQITVSQPKCIYTSPHHNTFTIFRLE